MGTKGQGVVFFWITALVGIVFVIATYIVFDTVLFAPEDSIEAALIDMGLNNESQVMTTLHLAWDVWPIAFVFAWMLALIVRSIIKEPDVGFR
jgi:hypothetical protein